LLNRISFMADSAGAAETFEPLLALCEAREAHVGVIGLGYVGLPLALALAEKGFAATGFDTDAAKIEMLGRGETYLRHIPEATVKAVVASGRFDATGDFTRLAAMDAILVCVPTPLGPDREPDLSFVVSTTEAIAGHLRPGQLVVLESTTYPGTTAEVVRPILEAGGLKSGRDFYLAYSPEREDPGNAEYGTANIPKVVGGDGEEALRVAQALYGQVAEEIVPVSSLETAEAVKLTENVFRAINIGLANELKLIYGKMGIDVWEVIEAAKTKPFGYMPFYPGPGLGGHCIPIDPFYLSWKARQQGQPTRFIELAGEINTAMPNHVADALADALAGQGKGSLDQARILLIGIAYKKDVGDVRESPAFRLIEILEDAGAGVDFHDPLVAEIPETREHAALAGRRSVPWNLAAFAAYDAALICTDHSGLDYAALVAACPLTVDTRNATAVVTADRHKIVKA